MTVGDTSATQFFFELTPERVLEAVESMGVRCTGRVLALNSMENRVYEVEIDLPETEIHTRYDSFRVVKFYRPGRWTREQIEEEHRFLIQCIEAEVPVVAPLPLSGTANPPEGGSPPTIGVVPGSGIYYAVFSKVGGRVLDEMSNAELAQIGRLIARVHAVGSREPHQHRLRLDVSSYGFANLEYLRSNKLIPSSIEAHYSGLAERLYRTVEPWFKEATYQRIHGDCHVGNVLWRAQGPQLVDFDDSLSGPCVQDIWLLTPGRGEETDRQRDTLLEGYEQMRSFDRTSLRLIEPLRALRMIHFTAWIARRYDDPAFKRVFLDFGSERYWREQLIALQEVGEQLGIG